jgi:predicted GTPase
MSKRGSNMVGKRFLKIKSKDKEKELSYDIRNTKNGNRVRVKANMTDEEKIIFPKILFFLEEHEEYWTPGDWEFKKIIIKDKISKEFKNEYSSQKFDELFEFTIKIFYKLISPNKIKMRDFANQLIPVSKEEYIRILFLGQFGVGKSTLIKAISDIPEETDFPVVDTSRTTTYPTTYIFKDNILNRQFKFIVLFKDYSEIYNHVQDCYERAINKAINVIVKEGLCSELQDAVMDSFVTDPDKIFKIEYVMGKYYKINSKKRKRNDKQEQVKFWDELYSEIINLVKNLFSKEYNINNLENFEFEILKHEKAEIDLMKLLKKDQEIGQEYDELIDKVTEKLVSKIWEICNKMKGKDLGEIKSEEDEIIAFYNENYQIEKISDYIVPFTSTKATNFTEIVTPLVKEMRIEVPYNKTIDYEYRCRTITITDTIGYEHRKRTDTKSLEGSTELNYNDFDIITIIDSAKQSMNSTTERILDDVYKNAIKSKIMMAYTFYNEYTKKEFEDEYDKEEELFNLQNTTLKNIDEKDKIEYFIEQLQERTVFLKDLVDVKEYKGYDCINKLFKSITNQYNSLYDFKNVKLIDESKNLLEYNYKKLALVFNYAQKEFLDKQENRYLIKYPHYKITEALTRRLANGGTYYNGAESLTPIDDFCYEVMNKLDKFIKAPVGINFEEKETIENHAEQVEDWIKEMVSQELKEIAVANFVTNYQVRWYDAYNDWDTGVDYRRRTKVVKIFNEILPSLDISQNTYADYWINKMEDIFLKVLDKAKEEILTYKE